MSAATNSNKRRASKEAGLGGEVTGREMVAWDLLYPMEFPSAQVRWRGSGELDSRCPGYYLLQNLGQKEEGRMGSKEGLNSGITGSRG
jgi:hypothetical protein